MSQLQLIESLQRKGEDVKLAIPSFGWCEEEARKQGVDVHYLPMPSIKLWTFMSVIRKWKKYLKDCRPDVIHANTSRSCFYAGVVGRLLKIPVLFHCRIASPDPKLDWMLAWLVDCVVANSNTTAKRFSRFKGLHVQTVYNGIDISAPNDCLESERPFGARVVVLCVARISRWKRHDLVLKAFEQLAPHIDGLHLICIGGKDPNEEDWWDELQAQTNRSLFSEQIHWVGMQEDMRPWYCGGDVLFLASECEPFGRVVVEAMAYELPVIAFAKGGPAEIIRDGIEGILLMEGDDFSNRLRPLFEDSSLRKKMGMAGRSRAGDFSLAKHVNHMETLLQSVSERKGR